MERWLPVVGFEGLYEVSDQGRVRSLPRSWSQMSRHGTLYVMTRAGQLLRPGKSTRGHLTVALGRGQSRCVHYLVLTAFRGPRPVGTEARHLDGDEQNNRLANLKWDTRGNNSRDKKWHRGAANYKLTPTQVMAIKAALKRPYHGIGAHLSRKYNISESVISKIKLGDLHIDVEVMP